MLATGDPSLIAPPLPGLLSRVAFAVSERRYDDADRLAGEALSKLPALEDTAGDANTETEHEKTGHVRAQLLLFRGMCRLALERWQEGSLS